MSLTIERRADAPPPAPSRAPFVELGVTSCFTFLTGASQPYELALAAQALGYDAIGIADRNTLAGVVRLHEAAKEAGLRPLIGCRLEAADAPALLCYPSDRDAYGRLCRLVSLGKMRAKKGECHIALSDIAAHAEGQRLIALPPAGPDLDSFEADLERLAEALPSLTHLAATRLYRGGDRARIERLDGLARRFGLTLIATNDVLYHAASRRALADVMTCIREKTTIARAGYLLEANGERFLKPAREMVRLFKDWPHAIEASRRLADAIAFSLDDLSYDYPDEPVPEGLTADRHLSDLTWGAARARHPKGVPARIGRLLDKELSLIAELGIAPYFLTINDIVAWARGRDILCQGRGSAANSAVCFYLGITNVDPSKHNLLFERFVSRERKEPPDIDVDFEHERREEVIQHIYERYGRARAGICATVIHYRPRSAIREVGRAMGLSEDIVAALAGAVWGWDEDLPDERIRQIGLDPGERHLRRTIALTRELIGMPRHLSQHVGGFVLTRRPLDETVPIGWAAMPDRSFIEWDKDDIDALGILKVDVLALGMLTCIRKAFDLLERHESRRPTLDSLPPDDEATYAMLQRGDSLGVFQVESRAQMNMLPRLKPACFYDLVIEVAIVRPGPIQGDMVHPYLRRRQGLEPAVYPRPADPDRRHELEDVLGRTLGVPLFQEQCMQLAIVAAEFTPEEANRLRHAMATFRRRGTIDRFRDRLVERMVARGYERPLAERVFSQIEGFGTYGFPESHAAAFAHLVYVSSWLKCHRPAAFACALLNSQPMGFYAPAQIVRDAVEHGVEVRPVDVNHSQWDSTLERREDGAFALRLGLRRIDGLRTDHGEAVAAARRTGGPFASLEEVMVRASLPPAALDRLAGADAFASLGLSRRAASWDALAFAESPQGLFAAGERHREEQVELPLMPPSQEVVSDYQSLKLSLKGHPVQFMRERLTARGILSCAQFSDLPDGARACVAGAVLVRQRPGSAKGVMFMTIEDETGIANAVVWPKDIERFRQVVLGARIILIEGRMQKTATGTADIAHLLATRLVDLTPWLADLREGGALAGDEPPLARADEVVRPQIRRGSRAAPVLPDAAPPPRPSSRRHPRDVRIIPKSRDFR